MRDVKKALTSCSNSGVATQATLGKQLVHSVPIGLYELPGLFANIDIVEQAADEERRILGPDLVGQGFCQGAFEELGCSKGREGKEIAAFFLRRRCVETGMGTVDGLWRGSCRRPVSGRTDKHKTDRIPCAGAKGSRSDVRRADL